MKDAAEKSCLTMRQIYDDKITSPKMKVQPFSKMSSTMQKRRLKNLPTVPKSFEGFKAARVGDLGKIDQMLFPVKSGKGLQ